MLNGIVYVGLFEFYHSGFVIVGDDYIFVDDGYLADLVDGKLVVAVVGAAFVIFVVLIVVVVVVIVTYFQTDLLFAAINQI